MSHPYLDRPLIRVHVTHRGPVPLVHIQGEMDLHTCDVVARPLSAALDRRPPALIVDMTSVRFLGAHGLTLLTDTRGTAREQGCLLALVGCGRPVARLLDITGTRGLFTEHPTVEHALAAFGTTGLTPAR